MCTTSLYMQCFVTNQATKSTFVAQNEKDWSVSLSIEKAILVRSHNNALVLFSFLRYVKSRMLYVLSQLLWYNKSHQHSPLNPLQRQRGEDIHRRLLSSLVTMMVDPSL